jgi:hypothetical protein
MFDAAPRPAQPTADEVNLGARIYGEFQQARLDRLPLDQEWWVQSERYEGNANVFYQRKTAQEGRVFEIVSHRPQHKLVPPLNLVGPNLDRLVAKQMRVEPIFSLLPTKWDQKTINGARAARDWVRWFYRARRIRSRRRRLMIWRNTTGNGYIKVFHNPSLGAHVDDIRPCDVCAGAGLQPRPPELEQAIAQARAMGHDDMTINALVPPQQTCSSCMGSGQVNHGRKPIGDIDAKMVSPWEVYPARGSREITDGCFHAVRMSKEEAASKYNIPAEELHSGAWFESQKEPEVSRLARSRRVVGGQDHDENYVYVVEKWLPPLPMSQRPRLAILVGNRVVYPAPGTPEFAQGWAEVPEPFGRIPIVQFEYRPSVENPHAHGVVKDVIPSNDYVNRSRQNTHEHHELMAAGKWLTQRGSLRDDVLTRKVGEVLEYEPGFDAPKLQQGIGLPDWLERKEDRERETVGEQMGLTHFDRGLAPPNVEAGYALNFLAEQGDMIGLPILHADSDAWADVARLGLIAAKHWYKPQDMRFRRISGLGSKVEVECFLQLDVENGLDIDVVIGTAAVNSVALRQQMVMDAAGKGLISPQDFKALMEWGSITGEDDSDRRLQESCAYAENIQIEQGLAAMPPMQPGMPMAPGMQPGMPPPVPGAPPAAPMPQQPPMPGMPAQPGMMMAPAIQHQIMQASDDHAVHYMVHRKAAVAAKIEGNTMLAAALEQAAMQHYAMLQPPAPTGTVDSGSQGQEDKPPA